MSLQMQSVNDDLFEELCPEDEIWSIVGGVSPAVKKTGSVSGSVTYNNGTDGGGGGGIDF